MTGNIVERNSGNGIYAEHALTTIFAGNVMLENALSDARDDAFGSNTWTATTCVTDNVSGPICGVDYGTRAAAGAGGEELRVRDLRQRSGAAAMGELDRPAQRLSRIAAEAGAPGAGHRAR